MSELALSSSLSMVSRKADFVEQFVHQALKLGVSQVVRSSIVAELKRTRAIGGAGIAAQKQLVSIPGKVAWKWVL